MKTFIYALILLSIIIVIIIANYYITSAITDDLIYEVNALPEPDKTDDKAEAVVMLQKTWDKKRYWLFATVKTSDIEKIDEYILRIKAAYITGNTKDFTNAKLSLLEMFSDLAKLSGLKLYNLF